MLLRPFGHDRSPRHDGSPPPGYVSSQEGERSQPRNRQTSLVDILHLPLMRLQDRNQGRFSGAYQQSPSRRVCVGPVVNHGESYCSGLQAVGKSPSLLLLPRLFARQPGRTVHEAADAESCANVG